MTRKNTNTTTNKAHSTDAIRARIDAIGNKTLKASALRIADAMDKGADADYAIAWELTHVNAWGTSDASAQGAYKSVRAYAMDVFDMSDTQASKYERVGRFVVRDGRKFALDERVAFLSITALIECIRFWRASHSKGDCVEVTAQFIADNAITGATRCADIRAIVDKALGKGADTDADAGAEPEQGAQEQGADASAYETALEALRATLTTSEQADALKALDVVVRSLIK